MTYTTVRKSASIRVHRDATTPIHDQWVSVATAPATQFALTLVATPQFRLATNEQVQAILDDQLVRMNAIFERLK